MGQYLGEGYTYTQAKNRFMPNDTVEGAELGFEIGSKILKDIPQKDFPLMDWNYRYFLYFIIVF